MRLISLLPLLAACERPDEPPGVEVEPPEEQAACGPQVTEGDDFFSRPFPDDARLVDGLASYAGLPQRNVTLVGDVVAIAERNAGWSPNGTLYVPFDGPITAALPDLAGTLEPDSLVRLAPIDPDDGEAIPLRIRVFDEETSLLPAHTLAVRPAWGRGMRPGVRYALTLAEEVGCSADGEPIVVPITAAPVTDPLAKLIEEVRALVPPAGAEGARFGDQWTEVVPLWPNSRAWSGRLVIPRWQSGEVPYATDGGDILFDDGGRPVLDGYDEVPVALTLPAGEPPPGGWPVLLHLNGTGGSHELTYSFGGAIALLGIASVGIDLPLHGERGAGAGFETVINYGNPLSSVTSFLQGAADQVWLVELLARPGAFVPLPEGDVPLDPTRIGYQGHSHGGIVGALAAAHFDGKVKAAMLSGSGGGTFLGALLNEGGVVDVAALVDAIFEFEDDEALDDFHPIASLVQHAADPVDPLNLAAGWFAEPTLQRRPLPAMLLTLGEADTFTPPLTTQAMAHAGSVPIVRGDYRIAADALFPPPVDELPVSGNTVGFDGTPVTAGLVQYVGGTHGVGLLDSDRWTTFFRSALVDDAPRIP